MLLLTRILCISLIFFYTSNAFAVTCPNNKKTNFIVQVSSSPIDYDFTKSKSQLGNFNIDTKSPYEPGAHIEVGGLMNGEITIRSKAAFGYIQDRGTGKACHWYDKVEVKMHVTPTIFIAKENKPGTCQHKAVLDHEMKHIKVDRAILKKYKTRINSALRKVVNKVGVVGPIGASASKAQSKMMKIIEKAIANETDRMYTERRRLQQSVDSLEEYERVANLCR